MVDIGRDLYRSVVAAENMGLQLVWGVCLPGVEVSKITLPNPIESWYKKDTLPCS